MAPGRSTLRAEGPGRDRRQVATQLFEPIGIEIHHALDQRGEHRGAVLAQALRDIRFHLGKRGNLGIAYGDEYVRGENKSERYGREPGGFILQGERHTDVKYLPLGS